MTIDYTKRILTINGTAVSLSKREFEIVELLSLNAGQIFDRERIYERIWGMDGAGSSDTIMEHIRKIRAKFASVSFHIYIETVWGLDINGLDKADELKKIVVYPDVYQHYRRLHTIRGWFLGVYKITRHYRA